MLAKKDFFELADALRPLLTTMSFETARTMVAFCRKRNDRFDADKWLAYLGYDSVSRGYILNDKAVPE